jgi:hypothetical protein
MTYEWILSSKPLNMQVSEEVLSRIYVEVAQQQSKHPPVCVLAVSFLGRVTGPRFGRSMW